MHDVFSTAERDAFVPHCLAPDVNWPNVADGVRLHGHKAVYAYWAAQFAAAHPLVRLEGLRLDEDGRRVVALVRPGLRDATGEHWAEEPSSTCTPSGTGTAASAGGGAGRQGAASPQRGSEERQLAGELRDDVPVQRRLRGAQLRLPA
ncbi:nuclear transport factor 2 family protein [Streptomyces sp. NPDC020747]|uniref:nuclear transport factor 2 family protein n=1 Tax=Streptomyces sp. NPDC020747 TaxID=3365086 RepID=UPI0037B1C900